VGMVCQKVLGTSVKWGIELEMQQCLMTRSCHTAHTPDSLVSLILLHTRGEQPEQRSHFSQPFITQKMFTNYIPHRQTTYPMVYHTTNYSSHQARLSPSKHLNISKLSSQPSSPPPSASPPISSASSSPPAPHLPPSPPSSQEQPPSSPAQASQQVSPPRASPRAS